MSEHIEVNVEEIMKEIRCKAQMEEDMQRLPVFESIPFHDEEAMQQSVCSTKQNWEEYLDSIGYLNRNYEIPYYWSFGSNSSFKVFIKRVVRKLAKCILFPILAQQNILNAHYVLCLNQLKSFVEESNAKNKELTAEVAQLRATEREHEQAVRELSLKLEYLEQLYKRSEDSREQMAEEFTGKLECVEELCKRSEDSREQMAEEFTGKLECMEELCKRSENDRDEIVKEFLKRLDHMEQLCKSTGERQEDGEARLRESEKAVAHISQQIEKLPVAAADFDTRLEWKFVSQTGEDMILEYIFRMFGIDVSKRTYLDLGANHAKFLSNTYYLYQKGARGVLVEANPALLGELKLFRGEDIILNRCVSAQGGETVDFYVISGDGLSTPDREQAETALRINPELSIEQVVKVETITPNEILERYFDGAPLFMNVDIEGNDLQILKSIDFDAHRPMVISVEMIPYRTSLVVGEKNQEILDLMAEKDYVEYAFTGINSIFIDKRSLR